MILAVGKIIQKCNTNSKREKKNVDGLLRQNVKVNSNKFERKTTLTSFRRM